MRLAHYTSIDTLALILDSEKIRFTRLDCLDDFNETGIYPSNSHKQFYVSCWSDPNNEIIPQWAMYGGNKRGVIILLDSEFINVPNILAVPVELSDKTNAQLVIFGTQFFNQPNEIKYYSLEDLKQKAQEIHVVNEDQGVTIYEALGKYKTVDWSFQNEFRFIIQASVDRGENHKSQSDFIYEKKHIDIPLKEGYKDNMQILIGPMCSNSDRIIINSLCEYYKITDCVESKYNGVLIK